MRRGASPRASTTPHAPPAAALHGDVGHVSSTARTTTCYEAAKLRSRIVAAEPEAAAGHRRATGGPVEFVFESVKNKSNACIQGAN